MAPTVARYICLTALATLAFVGNPHPAKAEWFYSRSTDPMTGKKNQIACSHAMDKLDFGFPYAGGAEATLCLRRTRIGELRVTVHVSQGQFVCNSFTPCKVKVRFGEHPMINMSGADAADGDPKIIFIEPENRFLAEVRKAATVKIEATFFTEGNRIMEFDTAGLDWKP